MTFALSKIFWALASPGSLLVLLLGLGLLLMSLKRPALLKAGKRLCVFVFLCLAAMAVLPVGDWALTPLENRFAFDPPDRVTGIIILGGDEKTRITAERGVPVALDSMRRYVTFAGLARRYPEAKLVFSGGSPLLKPGKASLDAEVAISLMAEIGVPVERLVIEKASRNTYENARFSMDVLKPEKTENWLLVTNAWHMPRAMGCFQKAGWNVSPAPTGYSTTGKYVLSFPFRFDDQMHALTLAVHEYIGLLAYRLMGRTSALWPG